MRQASRLGRPRVELLRRDQCVVRRREVVEAHLRLEALAADHEQPVQGRVRAGRGELAPASPQLLRVVRRDGLAAGHDAEEPGHRKVVAGDSRQHLRVTAGIGARDDREGGNRDVELLAPAAGDVDVDVDALRWRGGRRPRRERRDDDEPDQNSCEDRSSHRAIPLLDRRRTASRSSAPTSCTRREAAETDWHR